ncbi:helix-turn-helix domain-containing protein [Lysinibacillus sp. CD3-6]|uniref:helix-turn-helix domain-containing protein n=1 Tax=Lysinibacillus sp. CD3-6 TaxID=2892541 RepID=UPI00116CC47A|nr:helix-turn-helix transcriptional regulator [Lysinibacillus sp. CD3-6]UED81042.1 helix-turn-helix domain-containing protein [Lysinibacillus sp. CD3-6]
MMTTLGDRLRMARQKSGLKQTQVKERTNINNKTLSGYENNVSEPDMNTLATLTELYDVSYKWLLTGEGDMNIPSRIEKKKSSLTEKDERDIGKRMAKIKKDLLEGSSNDNNDALSFMGEPMSEEAIESLLEALEHAERLATLANKKFIPKKYRND